MAKELLGTGLTINGKRITGITENLSAASHSNIATEKAVLDAISGVTLTGANAGEIYNVKNYGAVANAVIPASGNVVTGTNNKTAFDTCIAAAPTNATVLVPAGRWLCVGGLAAVTSKRLNLIVLGDIYTNGTDFLTINAPGGADRHHTVIIAGSLIGSVNLPTHNLTTVTAGTSPNYTAMTGTAITLGVNVNGTHVLTNFIEGFAKAVEIIGGGGGGSQDNVVAGQKWNKNAIGISLRSTDGVGWCDKNYFMGYDGGKIRVGGDIVIKVDGYSGAASTNGEIYNGAFRSNEFYIMAEACNQVLVANADMTEPRFDITIEGGTNTGVFGPNSPVVRPAIQCRSVSPNYVRAPKYFGQGVMATGWILNGLGIDGTIEMPIWHNQVSYVGNKAVIDTSGNLVIEARQALTKAVRDSLPSNMSAVTTEVRAKNTVTTTAASYTVLSDDYQILCNKSSGACVVNLPTVNTNAGRELIVRNINAVGTVSHANGDPTAITTIAAGDGAIVWYCDGTAWRVKSRWHD
jgi:hypothetical protein